MTVCATFVLDLLLLNLPPQHLFCFLENFWRWQREALGISYQIQHSKIGCVIDCVAGKKAFVRLCRGSCNHD